MIYVIKAHHYDYESSISYIVGVCDTQKNAFDSALKIAINSAEDYMYDPSDRYRSCKRYSILEKKDKIEYNDTWTSANDGSEYTIEEWELNNEKGNRLRRWYVNFDKAIKTFIIENKIKSDMVETFIKSLETQLDTIDFCIEEKNNHFGIKRSKPTIDEIKKWNKLYNINDADIFMT